MSTTTKICILSDIRIRLSLWGEEKVFKCSPDGLETGEPLKTLQSDKHYRLYTCSNCGYECDGSIEFDKLRAHLGKRHELVDPFVIEKITP